MAVNGWLDSISTRKSSKRLWIWFFSAICEFFVVDNWGSVQCMTIVSSLMQLVHVNGRTLITIMSRARPLFSNNLNDFHAKDLNQSFQLSADWFLLQSNPIWTELNAAI